MKTTLKILAFIACTLLPMLLLAQAPLKFNYQGIARNASGLPLVSQIVGLRLSVLNGAANGTAQYIETHVVNTNQFGLFNVAVGAGTPVFGTMDSITWDDGDKYLKVEFDPAGGTAYTDLGATQLLSVPYALRAAQSTLAIPFIDTFAIADTLLGITNTANGPVAVFSVVNTNGTSAAVTGYVNSQFSNLGTAGIYGIADGTGGSAGLFRATNPAGNGPALVATAAGNGNAITALATNNGDGVETNISGNGNALFAWTTTGSTGRAARFANFNSSNTQNTVQISTAGTNNALLIDHDGPSGNIAVFQSATTNVARIDKTGRGFFNGGTQNSGADLAEAFDVTGTVDEYEAGDVLVIATDADRTVERSAKAYSTLVAGVYATKPGVLLTEESLDSDLAGKVPMGVVGVIPTKVCSENGVIHRGDLLVTSNIAGHAMKADPDKVKPGQVIGKALEEFNGKGFGKIRVLVNVK